MLRQYIFLLSLVLFFTSGLVSAGDALAEESYSLPVMPIAQRFSPADPNGDSGVYNCMPAALAIALQILSTQGKLDTQNSDISYPSIRQVLRTQMPDPRRGIAPHLLVAATPEVTQGEYTLVFEKIDPTSWAAFLSGELAQGFPVIIHVTDRNTLFDPWSRTTYSHVIVVYGIDERAVYYADPWDGGVHAASHDLFSYAWGKGHHSWLAFHFEKNQYSSFRDIIAMSTN